MRKLKAVIHQADEGGFWAEIPEIPGCCAQGLTREALLDDLIEAAEGCLLCACDADDPSGETIEITE